MGLMTPKIESAEALKVIAKETSKVWYLRGEAWMGIVANITAIGTLMVARIALQK